MGRNTTNRNINRARIFLKTVFSENSNTVNKNIETPAVKENVFDDIKRQ